MADALKALGYESIRVVLGAIVGMLPKAFSKVHATHRTPHVSTWIAGLVVGIPAGIWDVGTFADLGTLFAFIVVSAGVIVLRRTQPERRRGFRMPGVPWPPLV